MTTLLLVLVVLLTGAFAFLNGARDVSNAVAVTVRARSLTPTVAVGLAALFNLIGALISTPFALAFSDRLLGIPATRNELPLLLAGVLSACLWGAYQWRRGLPSSSTHALVGGLVGAAAASTLLGHPVISGLGASLWLQVFLPLLVSPVIAFTAALLLTYPAVWAARYSQPSLVHLRARRALSVSTAAVAFGHGLQDAQRSTTVILLALAASGAAADGGQPGWVGIFIAVLLTGGTLVGGWRISHTLGFRLVRVDPLRGFVAQLLSSAMLFIGAIGLHLPLSTTHTVTSAIVGTGFGQRFAAMDRRTWLRVLAAWVVTPLATAAAGAVFFLALSPVTG
ncbi:inorganic phosphate transporter family protein [Paenarthrobacter sp. DKR-5]|uniref:inorganic phosphate transporter n=1 Tax=Paenarthrobacter sp. DKR-5 TaxID=2835535 RepID=UPI001BDBBBA7|nr:inorganic phosphate transporter [Paenarthrobacter sp. DKR-5]MBT1003302.1 inorganic phosphate transporter family protein [Paenarthrobacter sp. DKR-5]